MEPSEFYPHYKIWLSKRRNKKKEKGNYVLGGGGAELLRLIGEEKDLGKAAKKLNISLETTSVCSPREWIKSFVCSRIGVSISEKL